jgi:hypothetical protein
VAVPDLLSSGRSTGPRWRRALSIWPPRRRVVSGVFGGASAIARKANAALVGLGDTRRILLSDTLLETHSDDEIESSWRLARTPGVRRPVDGAGRADGDRDPAYAAHRARRCCGSFGIAEMPTEIEQLPVLALVAGAVAFVLSPVAHLVARARTAPTASAHRQCGGVHERHPPAVVAEPGRGNAARVGGGAPALAPIHRTPSGVRRWRSAPAAGL